MPIPFLDTIDRRIVTTLQEDGRRTNVDVADAVGLSPRLACAGSSGWKPKA